MKLISYVTSPPTSPFVLRSPFTAVMSSFLSALCFQSLQSASYRPFLIYTIAKYPCPVVDGVLFKAYPVCTIHENAQFKPSLASASCTFVNSWFASIGCSHNKLLTTAESVRSLTSMLNPSSTSANISTEAYTYQNLSHSCFHTLVLLRFCALALLCIGAHAHIAFCTLILMRSPVIVL